MTRDQRDTVKDIQEFLHQVPTFKMDYFQRYDGMSKDVLGKLKESCVGRMGR